MATTLGQTRLARPVVPEPRKARPVLWWAAIGAAAVALNIYALGSWLLDLPPNVEAGPTKVPAYMLWNIRAQEIVLPLAAVFVLSRWLILPLLRRQKVPWDGLAATSLITLMWQNYAVDWFQWISGYNTVVLNRGSWYAHVPGWLSPNTSGFAEAPIWNFGFYGNWILLCMWYCFMMRLAKRRWPHLGKVGIFGVVLVLGWFMDVALELLWQRGGLYHYAGAPHRFLLFKGHYYQFPLLEMVLFGTCMAAVASVRYFRNDRGESVAERGIDDVRVGTRTKGWIRWLALAGIFNICFFTYNMTWAIVGLHSGPWPEDITKRSYFTGGVCGEKTHRACPGPGVPIPRPRSGYMDQNGNMSHEPDPYTDRPFVAPPTGPVPFAK